MHRNNSNSKKSFVDYNQDCKIVIHGDNGIRGDICSTLYNGFYGVSFIDTCTDYFFRLQIPLENQKGRVKVYVESYAKQYANQACIAVLCINTSARDCAIEQLHQYERESFQPLSSNGIKLVCCTGLGDTAALQQYCEDNHILFLKGRDYLRKELAPILTRQINALYANEHTRKEFFKRTCSIDFDLNKLNSTSFLNAINVAKQQYFKLYFTPDFILNTELDERFVAAGSNHVQLNQKNKLKDNEDCCRVLLNLLQDAGGTNAKSFKFLFISELFNLRASACDEIISTVITKLKYSSQLNTGWKKFLLFSHIAEQNQIPADVVGYTARIFNQL